MNIKKMGQVFTPLPIVELLLEKADYCSSHILDKYIMEPSCGDGAILVEVVKRYIKSAQKEGWELIKIKNGLEHYIYGVELDTEIYNRCISNLNEIAKNEGIKDVEWNIFNENTLTKSFCVKFDYVIGNPPYIRIQNMNVIEREYIRKEYSTCKKGNIDIYLAFYEWGINHIKKDGILVYITPNSFMYNSSSQCFRDFILDLNILKELINFESHQVFDVSTYSAIMILKHNTNPEDFVYVTYDRERNAVTQKISTDLYKNKPWSFVKIEEQFIIEENRMKENEVNHSYIVQYAITTMRDKIYVTKDYSVIDEDYSLFNGYIIENLLIHPVVKASTYNGGEVNERMIFPYELLEGKFQVINEEKMKSDFPFTYLYLMEHKEELLKRSLEPKFKEWYEFGRRQGIQQMDKEKLVFKHVLKSNEKNKVEFHKIPKNVFVYSGIFITGDDLEGLKEKLETEEFFKYCSLLGKDKNGGYKEVSSKIIKKFRY